MVSVASYYRLESAQVSVCTVPESSSFKIYITYNICIHHRVMQAEFPDTYADLWVYPHPPKKNEVYYLCQRMSPLYLAAMKWSVSLDKAIDHFSLDTVCIKSVFPNMYIGHCTVYTCLIVCIRKLSVK